ncbi:UDP-N-acetyl glucosamine 2-epimerase [Candidatus Bipolaricaulota bacterium]|nr:UDP-N-acetyl glucosamine 2-epimerase [Candidatus Bipolaricaulota bacterium]
MKIIHIVGARPQFIKMAVVSRAITVHNNRVAQDDRIKEMVIHTGQHYDENMSAVFFEKLEIPKPDYNLGIGSALQGAQTGRMLEAIETVLVDKQPDWVMVYGDTNSTLAGALAAAKLHIPIAHIEAGLRSFNKTMPEEINRVLTDHVSNLLFCPTEAAVSNLRTEGFRNVVNEGHLISNLDSHLPLAVDCELRATNYAPIVLNTGDVMYDSVIQNVWLAERQSKVLEQLQLKPEGYTLATIHRAENTDDSNRLDGIFSAFKKIAERGMPIVCPLHPRTRKVLDKLDLRQFPSNLMLIAPIPYLDMLVLIKHAQLVLTDSGGVQKEAFILRTPCVTLREDTEWVETVDTGWNVLAGADTEHIVNEAQTLLQKGLPELTANPYGDGHTAERIVKILLGLGT